MSEADPLGFEGFEPRDERRREALFTLANGHLSLRGSAPELSVLEDDGTCYPGLYRAGWYDRSPRRVVDTEAHLSALIRLPDPLGLNLGSTERWHDPRARPPRDYRCLLDLQTGCLSRYF
jgi:trehalose/maltose hydrolase-like predicted phosphorylase